MNPHHQYTNEEKQWLVEQDSSLTYRELTEAFNEHFKTNMSVGQIRDLVCKRLKVKRSGNKGQFKVGAKPKYKVGDEIIKAGYVYVKVSDEYIPGKTTNEDYARKWKRKSDLVWEKKNGKLPEGTFLIFLDGDTLNCDIDNLYPVTRSIHAVMTKNRWYRKNKDFTLATLKYCELLQTIKGEK